MAESKPAVKKFWTIWTKDDGCSPEMVFIIWRNFGFFCSVNHLSRPPRKPMFTSVNKLKRSWFVIGGFRSILFFCISLASLLVITSLGNHWLVCFEDFFWSFLFMSPFASTKIPLTMAIFFTILEQSTFILSFLLWAKLGECILQFALHVTSPISLLQPPSNRRHCHSLTERCLPWNERPLPLVWIVQNFFAADFDSSKPRRCQNIFSLIYTNVTIPFLYIP